jgi:hypothetical protein
MVTWQLTIDCADPARMVRFWGPVLGYEVMPPPEGHASWNEWYLSVGVPADELDLAGDGSDRLHDPTGAGPSIWFQVVPEPKAGKNRLHLDVYPTGRDRTLPWDRRTALVDARVGELVEAGATVRDTNVDPENGFYAVGMLDPEGNEFCVA